jgi:hypothetical protein
MRHSLLIPLAFLGLAGCVATAYPPNAQGTATVVTPPPDGSNYGMPVVTSRYVAPAPTTTYVVSPQATTTTTYVTPAPAPTVHYVVPTETETSLPGSSSN